MCILSKLRHITKKFGVLRQMSQHNRSFPYDVSRWQWRKFKDQVQFYVMLGLIPGSLFVGYLNLFVGPATLCDIPECYEPQYWEYYRSPVTRFLARYLFTNPQQEYEKFLSYLFITHEQMRLREIEEKIKALMGERNDYQAYYFRPVAAKYLRIVRESAENLKNNRPEY